MSVGGLSGGMRSEVERVQRVNTFPRRRGLKRESKRERWRERGCVVVLTGVLRFRGLSTGIASVTPHPLYSALWSDTSPPLISVAISLLLSFFSSKQTIFWSYNSYVQQTTSSVIFF